VRKTEADGGKRKELLSSQEREELKALRGEVRELRHSEAGRLDLTFHFFATPSALLRPGNGPDQDLALAGFDADALP
jgi:hypothetical protein